MTSTEQLQFAKDNFTFVKTDDGKGAVWTGVKDGVGVPGAGPNSDNPLVVLPWKVEVDGETLPLVAVGYNDGSDIATVYWPVVFDKLIDICLCVL